MMVIEGNHEIEEQAEKKNFVAYSSRFAFPSNESGSASTFYYSFNAGGIHFIMLGAYAAYNKSGKKGASLFILYAFHPDVLNNMLSTSLGELHFVSILKLSLDVHPWCQFIRPILNT